MIQEMNLRVRELRDLYLRATPRQRFDIAIQRLQDSEAGPNLLIQHVSAVEGFARAVALDLAVRSGARVEEAYSHLWKVAPVALIEDHIAPRVGRSPVDLFGDADWQLFEIAVQFRNLLVHEAAFLGQRYSAELIPACRRILDELGAVAGVSGGYEQPWTWVTE